MRCLLLASLFLVSSLNANAEDDGVDILRRKQESERLAASLLPRVITKVYYVEDLAGLFNQDDPQDGIGRIVEAVKKNVPTLKGELGGFPTNLSLVARQTEESHKEIAAYLQSLRQAKKTLEAAGIGVGATK